MRIVALFLVFILLFSPSLAETKEAYWQTFDITFWQTLPFATFWSHFVDRQLFPGLGVHWDLIMVCATAISIGNAALHTQKVMKNADL
ncbi:MAG: hypothetical protein WCT39_02805 [Candidatus Margulisiibacteriota bacterium]